MKSDDIIMKTGIVHILDSSVGVPVLSDCPIDLSGDLSDFLKAHIEKLTESDDVKLCRFGNDSPVKQLWSSVPRKPLWRPASSWPSCSTTL